MCVCIMLKLIPKENCGLITLLLICVFNNIALHVAADGDFTNSYFLSEEEARLITSRHREITRNESSSEAYSKTSCCKYGVICGLSTRTKIVGGTETAANEFPWMSYIFINLANDTLLCSGFLVTNQHVITAGHCVDLAMPEDLEIFLGYHSITDSIETDSFRVRASGFKIHPEFNKPEEHNNDIAIVTLKYSVRFTFNVLPICLPPFTLKYDGMIGTTAGWGLLSPKNISSSSLVSVDLPIIKQRICRTNYAKLSVKITPNMFCAGRNNMDACQGDSGGPFMISVKGRYFAIGIVAFGVHCGTAGIPGVFTRVDKFIDFIDTNIKGGIICL